MKKSILVSIMAIMAGFAHAQMKNPTNWIFSSKKVGPDKYEVHFTVAVDPGWHIYSQHTPEGGPIPTSFTFTKNPLVTLDKEVKEAGNLEKKNEPIFGVQVFQFSKKVDFVQTVTVKKGVKTNLAGSVEFMLCNDKECLPPTTRDFSISLK